VRSLRARGERFAEADTFIDQTRIGDEAGCR
jgi:hypothetical protein